MEKVIDRVMCNLCNIYVTNEADMNVHLLGRKHQLALHKQHMVEDKEKCSVFVTNLPNLIKPSEILQVFSGFGEVVENYISVNKEYAIIRYGNSQIVENLLTTPVLIRGKKANIKRRIVKNRDAGPIPEAEPADNTEKLHENLKTIVDFKSQIDFIISICQPNWQEVSAKYIHLCRDLQCTLQELFAGCIVHPFGSTVTGLGFNNSDVDVFVQINNQHLHGNNLTPSTCVNKARNFLCKYNHLFTQIRSIPNAKTPIVKFLHIPTKIHCDVNFKNLLGVCNSRLICYYLNLDSRLSSIMIVLKYWAKIHIIPGSCGKFTNYCLIMMFIFYMQQPPYNFPSVKLLQTENTVNFQDNWNGGFDPSQKYTNEALIEASAADIMYGFFEFYANFEYNLNIICPYLGCVYAKINFLVPEKLDDSLELYKINLKSDKFLPLRVESTICVQDPFELNHNISFSIQQRHLDEFISFCKLGSSIFKNRPVDQFALYNLLTYDRETFDNYRNLNVNQEFMFKIPFSNKSLNYIASQISLEGESSSEENQALIRKNWYELVNKFVLTFLTSVMKFEVSIRETSTENKSRRLNGQSDVHDNKLIDSVSYHCTAKYNMWEARKSIAKDVKSDQLLFIDKQIHLSDYILNVLYKDTNVNDTIVEFNFEMQAVTNPTEMCIHITKINAKKKSFKTLAVFVSKFLTLWFEKYIEDLVNGSTKKDLQETEPVT